jgi:DNA-directed RNA polymerase subunit beta'
MRTFHIGGAAQRGAEQSAVEATSDGSVKLINRAVVVNSAGAPIVMSRNCELILADAQGRERARYRVPYGARLLTDEGASVVRGQKLAEWDPFTLPILTERDGNIEFADLIESVTLNEVTDSVTGLSAKVVSETTDKVRNANLRPRLLLKAADGQTIQYFMQLGAVLNIENGGAVKGGDVLARLPRESSKTRDITGGLPRVAELFEARRPKDHAIISDIDGRVEFGKDYKAKRRILVVPDQIGDEPPVPREYLVPKGKHVSVQEGDYVKAGDPLVDGPRVPHDILRVLGVEALANYLVNEIQDVYRLQGVKINDKHIEVIVRQMLQKVEIVEPGDTTYLIGEQVDRIEFEIENERRIEAKERPARAEPVLQGITKASLQTTSFISAASFQETTRVLTEAATAGKVDVLAGLKENVIVGRLIPAGTGSVMNRLRALASQRDKTRLPAAPALPEPTDRQAAE